MKIHRNTFPPRHIIPVGSFRHRPLHRGFFLLVGTCSILMAFSNMAWSLSYSHDFDGVRNGASFSIAKPTYHAPPHIVRETISKPTYQAPPRETPVRFDQFLENRYQQQVDDLRARAEEERREAEKRAEEEKVRAEIERSRRLHNVENVQRLFEKLETLNNDEPGIRKRMKYTEQVQILARHFEKAKNEYLATLPSYRERLNWSMDHINVPPPAHPLHYHRILFWGLGSTPDEARLAALKGERDPFNGKPFDNVFAFGNSDVISDAPRVVSDHLLGILSGKLSPTTTRQLKELINAEADEVVCHSNGCRIVETLIATGKLKVSKLRILGGDNALVELDYLKKLKDERHVKEVSVYVVHGDQVPVLDAAAWQIMDLMNDIGHPLQSFRDKAADPVYRILGLAGKPGYNPQDPVQVHVLSNPGAAGAVQKHLYDTYKHVINGWTMSGLMKDGAMNNKYMIY
jgi:hypothetical protein